MATCEPPDRHHASRKLRDMGDWVVFGSGQAIPVARPQNAGDPYNITITNVGAFGAEQRANIEGVSKVAAPS
jgi:hypothetical protein